MTIARRIFNYLPFHIQRPIRFAYRKAKAHMQPGAIEEVSANNVPASVPAPAPASAPGPDINDLLHQLRGDALANLPKGADHFVSVGCSGTWYFNWIAEKYGDMHVHTGVEFYSPRPSDLPANVNWIANTAGNMPEIEDAVADIVFSGQNIEHLWPDDIVGFLLESRRILKEGGLLAIDSPNRRITAPLGWSHPEHIIEFEVGEMFELLHLAGYDVERHIGIWLCEDPFTGEILPFEEFSEQGNWPVSRRLALGTTHPESAFIWWIEARKGERPPQVERLRELVAQIYAAAWPERWNRLKTIIGKEFQRNGTTWFDSNSRDGVLVFGPYAPLVPGHYSVKLNLALLGRKLPGKRIVAICEVVSGLDCVQHARREIFAKVASSEGEFEVDLNFSLEETRFGVQVRIIALQRAHIAAERAMKLIVEPGPAIDERIILERQG